MENIICIELTKHNQKKLTDISIDLKLKSLDLIKLKELGADKIWFNSENEDLISFTVTAGGKDEVFFSEGYKRFFLEIKPFEIPKKSKSVDSILEKITKYGIKSLTKEEKDFLDNESK
jgi:hypothetical protein